MGNLQAMSTKLRVWSNIKNFRLRYKPGKGNTDSKECIKHVQEDERQNIISKIFRQGSTSINQMNFATMKTKYSDDLHKTLYAEQLLHQMGGKDWPLTKHSDDIDETFYAEQLLHQMGGKDWPLTNQTEETREMPDLAESEIQEGHEELLCAEHILLQMGNDGDSLIITMEGKGTAEMTDNTYLDQSENQEGHEELACAKPILIQMGNGEELLAVPMGGKGTTEMTHLKENGNEIENRMARYTEKIFIQIGNSNEDIPTENENAVTRTHCADNGYTINACRNTDNVQSISTTTSPLKKTMQAVDIEGINKLKRRIFEISIKTGAKKGLAVRGQLIDKELVDKELAHYRKVLGWENNTIPRLTDDFIKRKVEDANRGSLILLGVKRAVMVGLGSFTGGINNPVVSVLGAGLELMVLHVVFRGGKCSFKLYFLLNELLGMLLEDCSE